MIGIIAKYGGCTIYTSGEYLCYSLHPVSLSIPCSSNQYAACLGVLQTALKWFSLPHSPHVLPYTGYLWGGCMYPQYLHVLPFLIAFLFCHASSACVLKASSCFTHLRTWSPVISSVLLMTLSSLSIFLCMYPSLMPQINCSFTHLSSSWYLHSFAAILNCLIHSSTFSLLHLFSLQNWRGFAVSLSSLCSVSMIVCLSHIFLVTKMFFALDIF